MPSLEDLEEIEQEGIEPEEEPAGPSADPVAIYLKDIGTIPLMTPEEEIDTARRAAAGDEAAARRMVEANLRLVVSVAKRYQVPGMDLLDSVQNGNLGLIKAAGQFDPELGFKFSTYATWWIRQCITRGITDQSRLIRIPAHASDQMGKIIRASNALLNQGVEHPAPDQLAEMTGISTARVAELVRNGDKVISIDAAVGEDGDATLEAFLKSSEESPEAKVDREDMKASIRKLLDILPDREQLIISGRFGLDGDPPRTLEQLAAEFGITRERVRQLEAKALRRIRHPKYSRELIPYLEDFD